MSAGDAHGGAPRARKIHEFVAHAGAEVSCAAFGRKSCSVLATGADDRRVNVWAIGNPAPLLSLTGHNSEVRCVTFDAQEEVVLAGAASGTLKLWDLHEAKCVRSLTGHRSDCEAVDFHPFGEFCASGSMDTNMKVWDIRRRGCIHTYKGHTAGVTAVRFSPDGRWVVSGDEAGSVRLWDLTAGRMLAELGMHKSTITDLEFHPNEFLLATGSADRTVRLWDLETFAQVGCGGPDVSQVSSLAFTPDGSALLSCAGDALKVWGWEPVRCHDAVHAGWHRASDAVVHAGGVDASRDGAPAPPRLLGTGFSGSFVGVWAVDLSKVRPFGEADAADAPAGPAVTPPLGSVRAVDAASAGVRALDVNEGRQKRAPLARAPQLQHDTQRAAAPIHKAPKAPSSPPVVVMAPERREAPPSSKVSAAREPAAKATPREVQARPQATDVPAQSVSTSSGAVSPPSPAAADSVLGLDARADQNSIGVVTGESLLAGDLSGAMAEARAVRAAPPTDHAAALCAGHAAVAVALTNRLTAVRAASSFAQRGDIRAAARALTRAGDISAAADVVPSLATDKRLTLESAAALLPLCAALMAEEDDAGALRCAQAGINASSALLKAFGAIVRDTAVRAATESVQAAAAARRGGGVGPGIDLGFEDRAQRAAAALEGFKALVVPATRLATGKGVAALLAGVSGKALGKTAVLTDEKRECSSSAAILLDGLDRTLGIPC